MRTHIRRVRACTVDGAPDISICEVADCYWDMSPELAGISYDHFSKLYSFLSLQERAASPV